MLDHEVLELVIFYESEDYGEEYEETFPKSTNVAHPVKYAVNVTIYAIQGQIELKHDRQM